MRRQIRLLLLGTMFLASCNVFTAHESIRLEYDPVVLRDHPSAGAVTFAADVRNVGTQPVHVLASMCAVGYRLVAQGEGATFEVNPRSGVCGLDLGNVDQTLAPSNSLRIPSIPWNLEGAVPAGSYELTILVYHDRRYRELPAGMFALP